MSYVLLISLPLLISNTIPDYVNARYVKIQLRVKECLQLGEVEIYGYRPLPVWLQVKKAGNQFSTAYKYEVADDWTPFSEPKTLDFTSTNFYAGIAVTSHDNSQLATLEASEFKISPNGRRLEGTRPHFAALDVQWPNGNILEELMGIKKALGIAAEEEDNEEEASEKRTNPAKIIGSRNVLEIGMDGEDGTQSVNAIEIKVDAIERNGEATERKVDALSTDMKQMKDMMSQLIDQNKKLLEMKNSA